MNSLFRHPDRASLRTLLTTTRFWNVAPIIATFALVTGVSSVAAFAAPQEEPAAASDEPLEDPLNQPEAEPAAAPDADQGGAPSAADGRAATPHTKPILHLPRGPATMF